MAIARFQPKSSLGRSVARRCKPEVANKHSGYLVGGTSPFGTKTKMPVYVECSIFDLERIYINGGRRGYLVGIDPKELPRVLAVEEINAALVLFNQKSGCGQRQTE